MSAATPEAAEATEAVDVILDTNVVLDWLVFQHASGLAIGEAIEAGRLRWIVSPAMQEELTDVLGRLLHLPTLMRWAERHAPASREIARLAQPVSAPGPLPHPQRLRCTDPDDQCFIDLAVSRRTPWLITRDHALRRLARRARAFGVAVVTPEGWAATQASSDPWPHPHPLP